MIRHPMSPTRGSLLLFLFIALSLFSYLHATHRFTLQLRDYIQANVIEKADRAELYSFNDATTQSYLMQEISRNLASLCPQSRFQVLGDCAAEVISFKGIRYANDANGHSTLAFYETAESSQPVLQVAVTYRVQWGYLLGTQGLLALLVTLVLGLIPKPISPTQSIWIRALKDWGINDKHALTLTQALGSYPLSGAARLRDLWSIAQQTGIDIAPEQAIELATNSRSAKLDERQLRWLLKGLALFPQNSEIAFGIAESRDQLVFMPATKSIQLHGLELALADTPFFYFYWYALLRLGSDEGWYTNPAQTRPDLNNGRILQALFEKYGGHAKAASELHEKGLRAKTLDQNRSKIKDELVRHIGEELALPYLFDVQRDARTARFNYRISLPPELIQVVPEDLELVREFGKSPSARELAI